MKTIWIVDDEYEVANSVRLFLDLLGYGCQIFNSARSAAQELLKGKRPDAILLDINMPQVSGLEFLQFLRSKQQWTKVPVVMLSSEDAEVQIDQALKMGANAYLTKPVTIEELEKTFQKIF